MNRSDLHAYQRKAINFICVRRKVMLALDMGLGKTTSTLTALCDLLDACIIKRILVIAPLRVATSVWRQEAEKWEHLSHLSISVATGTAKERTEAIKRKSNITVINRENVVWLIKLLKGKWPFDAVVVDESSAFKSPSAQRFRFLKKVIHQSDVIVLLTGTPSPQSLMDLWSQLFLIDRDVLGRTVTGYRQRFFTPDFWGHSWTIKPGADKQIHTLIKPVVLSMQSKDYIELPDRIDIVERVTLPEKIMAQYKDFESNLFMEWGDNEIEAVSAAVLANKMLQFSNGAIYVNEDREWTELHTEKLAVLSEIIDENPSENILVAYNFRHDLQRILKKFPKAVVLDKTPGVIERWNKGKIKLMLAHPASCGHGLNIQFGGSMIVWFGMTWNLENYLQMCARLHRQGQNKPVRVIHLVAGGTIDERVLGVLRRKDAVQNDLLKALKG